LISSNGFEIKQLETTFPNWETNPKILDLVQAALPRALK
jgi:hypothetical protein